MGTAASGWVIAGITAPLVLLGRRVRANWKLLAVIAAGVLVASSLLASAPMYLDSVKELGLRHSLKNETAGVLDVAITVPFRPLDPSSYNNINSAVDERAGSGIAQLVEQRVAHIRTPPLDVSEAGSSFAIFASIQSFSNYEEKSHVVQGAFPRITNRSTEAGARTEVAIGAASASAFRLNQGDQLVLTPGDRSRSITVDIVGILDANDIGEQYWDFSVNPFAPQVDGSTGADIPVLPFLISEDAFLTELPQSLRGTLVNYWWYLYVDEDRITSENVEEVREAIGDLESNLAVELPGSIVLSGLPATLDRFDRKLFFSRVPIVVMLILTITLVLYYLVMVANIVVDRHMGEIALLRSRGARASQVMAIYLWEAFFIAAVAVIVGPLLGRLLVPLLGKLPAFDSATGGASLPVTLGASAFLFSLAGAGLSFLVLVVPALRGARFNLLDVKATVARPPSVLFFHKYYIDLFLLALSGFLYWELTQQGSLVTQRLFGNDSTDILLLAAPALFIMSVSLAILRFMPLVLNIVSGMASQAGKVWLVMGLRTIARNPVQHMRPILLLALVAGLATFAASFNSTVQRSFEDRGAFEAGADARIVGIPSVLSGTKEELAAEFESQRGVTQAAAAFRPQGVETSPFSRGSDLLLFDTLKFQRISFFRDDFSERSLFSLLRHLDQGRSITRGRDLPDETSGLGIWIRPAREYSNVSLWMRVRDGNGSSHRFRLGRLDFKDWRFLQAELSPGGRPLQGPLVLESIYVWELDFPDDPFPLDLLVLGHTSSGALSFSDLTAFTPSAPGGTVVEPFTSPDRWRAMTTNARIFEQFKASETVTRDGQNVVTFEWQRVPGVGTRGILPSEFHDPLPIIASQKFLAVTGSNIGDVLEISVASIDIPVRIADSVEFFPTMRPGGVYLLGNVDVLLYYANLFRGLSRAFPNEMWIALDDDTEDRDAFFASLRTSSYGPYALVSEEVTLRALRSDPLVGAGSRGIVFTAFIVLIIVAIGGYLGYAYVSSFRLPMEFAVLRALGLSGGQLMAFQLLVHATVILSAVALGTWVGIRAHSMMITFLENTQQARGTILPFAPHTDWSGLGVVMAASAVILVIVVAWLTFTFVKVPIWRVLRGGEQ